MWRRSAAAGSAPRMSVLMFCWLAAACAAERNQSPLLSLEELLKPPTYLVPQLSPDGEAVSFVSYRDGAANIWLLPLEGDRPAYALTREVGNGVRATGVAGQPLYRWSPDGKWMYYVTDHSNSEQWRVNAVNVATGEVFSLDDMAGVTMSLLAAGAAGRAAVHLAYAEAGDSGLYLVDFAAGEFQLLDADPRFDSYFVDHKLSPRLAVESFQGGYRLHRRDSQLRWQPLFHIGREDSSALLRAIEWGSGFFDADSANFYLPDSRGRDKTGLVKIDLAAGAVESVLDDARGDIENVLFDPHDSRLQGYAVTRARKAWTLLDPALQPAFGSLQRAESGDIDVLSQSRDGRRWLVRFRHSSVSDRVYLFTLPDGELDYLFDTHPDLPRARLSELHDFSLRTADGFELLSYYLLPPVSDPDGDGTPDAPLPAVLLIHGGPSDERASYGFFGLMHWLANRGYAVFNLNFRGSPGFGKRFLNAQNLAWGREMHRDVMQQLDWAVSSGIIDRSRVAILGGSYGGYEALVAMTRDPARFPCGIAMAAPSDMERFIHEWWEVGIGVDNMAYKTAVLGDPDTPRGQGLLRDSSPIHRAHSVSGTLLLVHGGRDRRVPIAHAESMAKALQRAGTAFVFAEFPDEGHGFQNSHNETAFLAAVEHFLAHCLGGRAGEYPADIGHSTIILRHGADLIPGLAEALR